MSELLAQTGIQEQSKKMPFTSRIFPSGGGGYLNCGAGAGLTPAVVGLDRLQGPSLRSPVAVARVDDLRRPPFHVSQLEGCRLLASASAAAQSAYEVMCCIALWRARKRARVRTALPAFALAECLRCSLASGRVRPQLRHGSCRPRSCSDSGSGAGRGAAHPGGE